MYSTDFVRWLCREISAEEEPRKVDDLISLLQAVIKDDHEEVRTRMAFLAKKYAGLISDSTAAD